MHEKMEKEAYMDAGNDAGSSGTALCLPAALVYPNTSATAETMAARYAMDVREPAITMAPAGEDLNGLKAESGSGLSPSPDIEVRGKQAGS